MSADEAQQFSCKEDAERLLKIAENVIQKSTCDEVLKHYLQIKSCLLKYSQPKTKSKQIKGISQKNSMSAKTVKSHRSMTLNPPVNVQETSKSKTSIKGTKTQIEQPNRRKRINTAQTQSQRTLPKSILRKNLEDDRLFVATPEPQKQLVQDTIKKKLFGSNFPNSDRTVKFSTNRGLNVGYKQSQQTLYKGQKNGKGSDSKVEGLSIELVASLSKLIKQSTRISYDLIEKARIVLAEYIQKEENYSEWKKNLNQIYQQVFLETNKENTERFSKQQSTKVCSSFSHMQQKQKQILKFKDKYKKARIQNKQLKKDQKWLTETMQILIKENEALKDVIALGSSSKPYDFESKH